MYGVMQDVQYLFCFIELYARKLMLRFVSNFVGRHVRQWLDSLLRNRPFFYESNLFSLITLDIFQCKYFEHRILLLSVPDTVKCKNVQMREIKKYNLSNLWCFFYNSCKILYLLGTGIVGKKVDWRGPHFPRKPLGRRPRLLFERNLWNTYKTC